MQSCFVDPTSAFHSASLLPTINTIIIVLIIVTANYRSLWVLFLTNIASTEKTAEHFRDKRNDFSVKEFLHNRQGDGHVKTPGLSRKRAEDIIRGT